MNWLQIKHSNDDRFVCNPSVLLVSSRRSVQAIRQLASYGQNDEVDLPREMGRMSHHGLVDLLYSCLLLLDSAISAMPARNRSVNCGFNGRG